MSGKTRLDLVLSTKDAGGKARYTKVGSIWLSRNEAGEPTASVSIDAGVSISTPQGTYLNGYVPKARDDQPRQQRNTGGAEDDLPF
jgi:hypothetical protein